MYSVGKNMKKLIILLPVLSIGLMGVDSFEDWKISGRLNAYIQSIDVEAENGLGSDREGTTHNEELTIRAGGKFKNGKAGIELRGRTTNDDKIQKDGAVLQYLKAYYRDKIWSIEAGDVSASMNPYVFGGSLKGIKAVYKSPEKERSWSYTFISGIKKSSWKELYTSVEGEAPDSYVGAFEAKYQYKRSQTVSLSVSALKDDLATGDANSSVAGKKGISFGLDGKWRFNRSVTLKGRGAITSATDDLKNDKSTSSHSALLIKLLTKPTKSLRSNFTYTRVASQYIALMGSAPKDTEQFENSNTWRINRQFTAKLGLRARRDNLDGSLGATQKIYYEKLSLLYKPKFLKRSNFNFRASNKLTKGRGADNKTRTFGVDFNYRPKGEWRYGAGIEYSKYDDDIAPTSSRTTKTAKATLGYKKKLDKERSYRAVCTLNYQRVHQNGINDDDYGLKLDLGYSHSKKLSFDLLYMSKYAYKTTSNDTQNSTYQARATYRIDKKQTVKFLLEKRAYDIENDGANSYNEYKGKLSYTLNF